MVAAAVRGSWGKVTVCCRAQVTPLDFVVVLDRIKSRQRDNFKYWFQQTT